MVLNITQDWIAQLKTGGYRLTGPRYHVVEILAQSEKALTAQDIYHLAHQHYPSIGLVSVYRTLEKLEQLRLIQRVHRKDNCHAYVAAPSGHEHLLICRTCGRVDFFKGDDLNTLEKFVEHQTGYQVQEHWLQFIGVCRECQRSGNQYP